MPNVPAEWTPHAMPTLVVGRLARLLLKLSDERLRTAGITAAQLPVLVALKNGEQRTQGELARMAGVEQPSMAQLLARMERDGLIKRERTAADKRSAAISLTDQALALLEPGREVLRGIDRQVCAGLQPEEQHLLLGLLERMIANAGSAD
ncbi:MarR family transcriptional regulator [Xanthomonas protegens]|uniref:MarR family transcriptional regulator n=1 Tax=Xanthomonas protegens TaxID=3380705 RepID=A0ABU9LAL7_9XANT